MAITVDDRMLKARANLSGCLVGVTCHCFLRMVSYVEVLAVSRKRSTNRRASQIAGRSDHADKKRNRYE
jgi:hypothetical protein